LRLKILTWNIHKCIGGTDRKYDPTRIREVIIHHNPDIVFLQEVDDGARRSSHHRQVDVLGDFLKLRHRTFFPNVRVRGGGHYGNAILSKFPITETRNIDLSIPLTKRRSVLHAWIRVRSPHGRRSRTLHVFNLHLGLSQVIRKWQLQRFLASHPFASLHHRTPVIVGGDFNDVWGTLGTKYLRPLGFRTSEHRIPTFPAVAPALALDALYSWGDIELLRLERSRLDLAHQASDHLPLIAELKLKN
jgi:endonuclease/exonuclease/phosphatase family metal-dependent hydrolase